MTGTTVKGLHLLEASSPKRHLVTQDSRAYAQSRCCYDLNDRPKSALPEVSRVHNGVKSALSSAGGRHLLHFDHFASLLLTISFGFGMVNYYSNPLPGVGASFHNLITDESEFLANKINQTELQTVEERIADFEVRMDAPGVTDLLGTLMYAVIVILLAAAQAIAIVVIAFGFIATAVCVLVGPIFVPFFIVPKMEWLFWGWFRCFIQYAFYQVIAAAVVYVIANLILGIMDLQPQGTISTVQLIEAFPVLFITFLASIYALLKIPTLTNHIFSGTSGGSSAGLASPAVGGLLL